MNTPRRSFVDTTEKLYDNSGNQALLKFLPPLEGRRVLDLGCGAGSNARAMSTAGAVVGGVTLSLSEARTCAPSLRWVVLADLTRPLPFDSKSTFDLVVISHVLEHLADPIALLRAVQAFLSPGGVVAIAVPSVTHYSVRSRLLKGNWTYVGSGILDWTHLRFFSRSGIVSVCDAAGYEVAAEGHEGAFPFWMLRHILPAGIVQAVNRLSARAWPELFATQFVYLLQPRQSGTGH
jgi:SAM-dependent methyltransferase